MPKTAATYQPAAIAAVKRRFLAVNRDRLARTREALRDRQRLFLDVLPLLFHTNRPMLPGFVSNNTPIGVSDYSPSKKTLESAKRLARSFEYKRRALSHYDITSLFLIGSSGTIAHSTQSDFDIWICHRQGLEPDALMELQQKAQRIQEWGSSLELEVHFFLMEAESFKNGLTQDLSIESSGSAQYHLLKDEFYRTGLLLAGQYPLWWLVSPDEESDYEEVLRELRESRAVRSGEGIDFGGLDRVPVEEFFGAALWQLYKGIDSPYKSVLKILLMEAYATDFPSSDLLSRRYKRAIYAGDVGLNQVDPYIMLLEKIEGHLKSSKQEQRLDLARRCFYFKVSEQLSKPDTMRNMTWRRELMRSLADAWGWEQGYLSMLDSRSTWTIQNVLQERRVLVEELTQSYQFLSKFARENSTLSAISQEDLHVLGRKLYAAFERKAGKVDIVNRGIAADLWERNISFHQLGSSETNEAWVLYSGAIPSPELADDSPLKRGRSIVELVAWCHFNRLLASRTGVTVYSAGGVTSREVKEVVESFEELFPEGTLGDAGTDDLVRPPRVLRSAVYVNLGLDPLAVHTSEGRHLTTSRTDALSYSGLNENLALTFDQVLLTSWNEVLTFRFSGEDALMDYLSSYFQWTPRTSGDVPPEVTAYCFSSGRAVAIAKRIEQLIRDVIEAAYGREGDQCICYVVHVGSAYYALEFSNDVPSYQKYNAEAQLMQMLSEPQAVFRRMILDRYALQDTIIPCLFEENRRDRIQLFFEHSGGYADVYVLDEHGSLFHQRLPFFDSSSLLNQFKVFFDAIRRRRSLQGPLMDASTDPYPIDFYRIRKDASGRTIVEPCDMGLIGHLRQYFTLQVIAETGVDNQPLFTFYCDGQEFNTLEFGPDLYTRVAGYILDKRKSGLRYPIYITDLDLPHSLLGHKPGEWVPTVTLLSYKKLIEEKLKEAIEGLDRS